MITSVTLHDGICDFLETNLAPKFKLPAKLKKSKETVLRHPIVHRNGFIIPKSVSGTDEDEIAFILPWLRRVENIRGDRESVATVEILFGVLARAEYDDEGDKINDGGGYRDLWNLIETTRQLFFTTQTIDNKFRITEDFFEAEMLPEQIYPYWEGFCRTRWHIGYPMPGLGEKFF